MKAKPYISIITVCYNSEKTIERTIKSVISQNYRNLEYIIIDGASTDNTLSIIDKYKNKISKIISEPDKGIYDAMNKGIKISTGDYISFLNSDDYYLNNTLESLIKEIKSNPAYGIYHGNVLYSKEKRKTLYRPYPISKNYFTYIGMPVFHPTMFVHNSVFKQIGMLDINFKIVSDYKFTFSCFLSGIKFHYCPDLIVAFSAGGASAALRIRLKEGMRARKQLGIPFYKRAISYVYRLAISILSKIKNFIFS